MKVCMFVYNNCTNDTRVLKEAATLNRNGYKVKIIALKDSNTNYYDLKDGIEIFRVDKNPIHYRIVTGEVFKRRAKISFDTLRNLPVKEKTTKKTFEERDDVYVQSFKLLKSFLLVFHKQLCYRDFKRRAYKLNKTEASDIYHAHDLNTLSTAYKSAKLTNAKFIYDSHELYIERNKAVKPTKFYKSISRMYEQRL